MSGTLMRSVSGVRGIVDRDLTPEVVARYVAAFARLATTDERRAVVLARDSRESGPRFAEAAREALLGAGADVVECGMIPTPTAQLAVEHHRAAGGIIITASHNPIEWNALKFVGADGLFLERELVDRLFRLVDAAELAPQDMNGGGTLTEDREAVERHLEAVLGLPFVEVETVRERGFTVALDCVRGVGGVILPQLLERLGCEVVGIDLETDGRFTRAPEPVPGNLAGLREAVRGAGADVGMAVDPDGDRMALVDEAGEAIGEDYTLAFGVRAVLERRSGPVAVNLSTSLVVDDVARQFGCEVHRAPVGEANVARAMQRVGAVVGGEGNGGVMLPDLHLGRDAPLAAALVLDLLARSGETVRGLVTAGPQYAIVKAKVPRGGDLDATYAALESGFGEATVDRQDGLRLAWPDRWLHVRPSGTEPIVRLIAEAPTPDAAEGLIAASQAVLAGA
jgi:phosphomannomutase